MDSREYDPRFPRACFVLQYVHAFKHPVLIGTISTSGFRLTFGKSNGAPPAFLFEEAPPSTSDDSILRSERNLTVFPLRVSSTTSTTLSICWTPITESDSHEPFGVEEVAEEPCGTLSIVILKKRIQYRKS